MYNLLERAMVVDFSCKRHLHYNCVSLMSRTEQENNAAFRWNSCGRVFNMGSLTHNILCGLSRENIVSRFLTIKVDVALFPFSKMVNDFVFSAIHCHTRNKKRG